MAAQSVTHHRSCQFEPFRFARPAPSIFRQADCLSNNAFREWDTARETLGSVLAPGINVTQNERKTCITAELPGVKKTRTSVMSGSASMDRSSACFVCPGPSIPSRCTAVSSMAC